MPKKCVVHNSTWWNFARIIFNPFLEKIFFSDVEFGCWFRGGEVAQHGENQPGSFSGHFELFWFFLYVELPPPPTQYLNSISPKKFFSLKWARNNCSWFSPCWVTPPYSTCPHTHIQTNGNYTKHVVTPFGTTYLKIHLIPPVGGQTRGRGTNMGGGGGTNMGEGGKVGTGTCLCLYRTTTRCFALMGLRTTNLSLAHSAFHSSLRFSRSTQSLSRST